MSHARRQNGLYVLTATCALGLVGCRLGDGEYFGHIPEPDPKHLRWCTVDPAVLDPATYISAFEWNIFQNLLDALALPDETFNPSPALATHWEPADGYRTFTFYLHPEARFSNGRPLTADDVRFSAVRLLHPLSGSTSASFFEMVRHAKAYSAGTAKQVLADSPPFRKGEAVEITETDAPDPNGRIARAALSLHAEPAASSEAYASVDTGAALTIVELNGDRTWAYVHHAAGEGVYGWVELARLDNPSAVRPFQVAALDEPVDVRRTGTVPGARLLGLPELLGIEVIDDHTIVFKLEKPTPHFAMRGIFVVAREAVSRWPRSWYRPEHIVTSGPFELVEWRPRDRLELRRSATYWGKQRAGIERVTIRAFDLDSARANLYYAGFCDVADDIPDSYAALLLGKSGSKGRRARDLQALADPNTFGIAIDVRKLSSLPLRRALAQAMDRRELASFLKADVVPAAHWSPARAFGELSDAELQSCGATRDQPGGAVPLAGGHCYLPPLFGVFDPSQARRHLAEARRETSNDLPDALTISYSAGRTDHRLVAEWLQASWTQHLGLDVRVTAIERKAFWKEITGAGLAISIMGFSGDSFHPENLFLDVMRCRFPDNPAHYCDPEYERLLDLAASEADLDRRLDLLRLAEQRLADQVPVIPLYRAKWNWLQKPYVQDLGLFIDLRNVSLDPDWRKGK